jgi:DNA/RNA endonuclease YhcR with UshA esterase domain
MPGTLTGLVFRDDNSDNQYTPGTDTPAPNLPVVVYAGTGTAGTPLLNGATDADGRFAFTGLRPGEYTVVFRPFPSIRLVGDSIRTVTVRPSAAADVVVRFTGSLRISIAEARMLPQGSTATVEGVITVSQGTFGAQNSYIHDNSGGIQLFRIPEAAGLQVGDSVRVTGILGNFGQELQIQTADATSRITVNRLATGRAVTPRPISAAQFLARTFEGELVRLSSVRVDSIPGGTGAAFTVVGRGPNNERIEIRNPGAGTGITRANFEVGTTYTLTGLAGSFNGVPQIKPRNPADLQAAASVPTIASIRARSDGDTVTAVGVVVAAQGTYSAASVYVQDRTSGIQVFNVPTDANLRLGDSVQVTGLLGTFSGDRQIARFSATSPPLITRLGTGAVPAPRAVTGADVLARNYEGTLVRASNLTVVSVTGTTSHNVVVRDAAGTEFTVRVDALVASGGLAPSTWQVGAVYDVTGIQTGFTSGGQLKPRSAADVVRR